MYVFLFLGAYGQDFFDFILYNRTVQRWWNDKRIWTIKGLTCHLFGFNDFFLKSISIFSTHGFNLTSKGVDDDDQKTRYEDGGMIREYG